jgi:hypothetical protein
MIRHSPAGMMTVGSTRRRPLAADLTLLAAHRRVLAEGGSPAVVRRAELELITPSEVRLAARIGHRDVLALPPGR